MFPIAADKLLEQQCEEAAAAVEQARNRFGDDAKHAPEPIAFTAVLHAGVVSYDNIGATHRLDFTVIGPAVNIASRVEGKAKELGHVFVVTAEVANCMPRTKPVGAFELKGMIVPVELFVRWIIKPCRRSISEPEPLGHALAAAVLERGDGPLSRHAAPTDWPT